MEAVITQIPLEEVLRYMGHRGAPDPRLLAVAEDCSRLVLEASRPRWLYDVSPLARGADGVPLLARWDLPLPGADIRRVLAGCDRAVLLCATLSLDLERLLRRLQLEDLTRGLAGEAAAAAAVEVLCDRAEEEIRARYPGHGLTRRFSPGYGDLPLTLQGPILAALEAQKRIGLWLGDGGVLIPRKSVTAILGVAPAPLPKEAQNKCDGCTLGDRCPYGSAGKDRCHGQA